MDAERLRIERVLFEHWRELGDAFRDGGEYVVTIPRSPSERMLSCGERMISFSDWKGRSPVSFELAMRDLARKLPPLVPLPENLGVILAEPPGRPRAEQDELAEDLQSF